MGLRDIFMPLAGGMLNGEKEALKPHSFGCNAYYSQYFVHHSTTVVVYLIWITENI